LRCLWYTFFVMRDRIELEEIFEADPQARAEFEAVCNEWQTEAITEQEAELKAMAQQEGVSK
jgi:hypothetical protein